MMILFAILTLIYRAVWYITKYTQLELYNFAGRAWVLTCWRFIVKKKNREREKNLQLSTR